MSAFTHQRESRILCPFYRGNNAVEIGCEGITDKSVLRLIFNCRADRHQHETIFCADHYRNCELYAAILRQYEED